MLTCVRLACVPQAVLILRPTRENMTLLKRELRAPRYQQSDVCECRANNDALAVLCVLCAKRAVYWSKMGGVTADTGEQLPFDTKRIRSSLIPDLSM